MTYELGPLGGKVYRVAFLQHQLSPLVGVDHLVTEDRSRPPVQRVALLLTEQSVLIDEDLVEVFLYHLLCRSIVAEGMLLDYLALGIVGVSDTPCGSALVV